MKVSIKRERCSGHARCAAVAPELFSVNDDGYIDSDGFDVPPGMEEIARKGVRACPERALRIVEANEQES